MVDSAWRSEDVRPEDARWVMSAAGREVLEGLLDDDARDPLAVATALRERGLEPGRAATAQGVAAASRRARAAGHPDATWWTPAALEQAGHPTVAAWRARRHAGAATVDLTAGCGGDATALAGTARELLAVEADPARVPFLRANLATAHPVVRADARRPPLRPGRWSAWADPGRRAEGRRIRALGGLRPPVPSLTALGFAGLGIAVSPAMDLDDPDRPDGAELEFVQVDRQLTEAVLWLGDLRERCPAPTSAWATSGPAPASATLLPSGEHVRGTPTGPLGRAAGLGAWLAEPAPALVRARLADGLASHLDLARVARGRALFTGDHRVASPWFRCEAVEAVVAARPAAVRDALDGLDPLPTELLTHGMQVDPDGWWKALGSPPRGPSGRAIHLARLDDRHVAILTRRGD